MPKAARAKYIHCIIYKRDNKIATDELHRLYSKFVEARANLEMKSQASLTKRVKTVPYAEYSRDFLFKGKRQRGFKHIDVLTGKINGNYHAFSYTSLGKEKDSSGKVLGGVVNKRGNSRKTGEKVEIRATKAFDYDEKSFAPGDTARLPEKAAEKAIGEGYAKRIEKPELPSQLDKIRVVRDIIHDLRDDYEGGAPLNAVKRRAEAEAVSPRFVEEFVKRESESGRLIRTKEGDQTLVEFIKRGW